MLNAHWQANVVAFQALPALYDMLLEPLGGFFHSSGHHSYSDKILFHLLRKPLSFPPRERAHWLSKSVCTLP